MLSVMLEERNKCSAQERHDVEANRLFTLNTDVIDVYNVTNNNTSCHKNICTVL